MCGNNSGTITNCYNIGTISATNITGVGGVCGTSSCTIEYCYYLDTCGTNFTCSEGISKNTNQFESGEVAYLLNQRISDSPTWYQNIDKGTQDDYPVLDNSHQSVYASSPCKSKFSNTPGKEEAHSYVIDAETNTKHKCEK